MYTLRNKMCYAQCDTMFGDRTLFVIVGENGGTKD